MLQLADARSLMKDWRGDAYAFGLDCLDAVGEKTAPLGSRTLLVANHAEWLSATVEHVVNALGAAGVQVVARCEGAKPNSPLEDVYRIQDEMEAAKADVVVAVGAGSTIDATKAALVLARLSLGVHDVNPFFGVGRVTEKLAGVELAPLVAVETAASSGSHLTKYANVTDLAAGQKKLIVDMAIVPRAAVFDYSVTTSASKDLTCDGAFDGMSHCIEVYYGAKGDALEKAERIALAGVSLIISSVADAVRDPGNLAAREALGLGTDLGGYAIMVGSTSGGHLTSFSLVDVTTHGRATAILNPYYTVLFAPAIGRQLRALAELYAVAGLMSIDTSRLSGRDLAIAVAEAMMALSRQLGYPTSIGALPGFTPAHIDRAIAAAKDPQLKMKLQAMPVPMDAAMVDQYMRPVLEAAAEGNVRKVVTLK
jgi:alcohol dehydrogenase